MAFGISTINNIETLQDSGRPQAICIARGTKDYSSGTTTGNFPDVAAWANIGSITLEKLYDMTMTEQFPNTSWRSLKYTLYIHDTGNHSGSWGGGVGNSWSETSTNVSVDAWQLSSGTGDTYTNSSVSGTLYFLVFAELPEVQEKASHGLEMWDALGNQTYNSYYMPLQIHGYVSLPPSLSTAQNYTGIYVPDSVDPDRYPAVPSFMTGWCNAKTGLAGSTHRTVLTYQDKGDSGWVSIRPSGARFGASSATPPSIFSNHSSWRIPIIHARDYF